eukprot:16451434-Heterocapsa_arctica.AAC.1
MAWERGWKPLERLTNQCHGWYAWGTMKKHLQDPQVWSEDMTDKELWTVITETRNHKEHSYSFMINVFDKECAMIKATPRGGIGGKGTGNGGKGSGGKTPDGGSDKGDGKGQKGAGGGKDGKGKTGAWGSGGYQSGSGGQSAVVADGGEKQPPGGQKEVVTDPGPPPDKKTIPVGAPPPEWFIGQYTPATCAIQGIVDTWKQVKVGDQCPWDNRVATCVKQEWKGFKK